MILRLLRRHRSLSRVEIAKRSKLSDASVSRTVKQLVRRGLVTEAGMARTTGGRPSFLLQLDESHRRSIGVDIHSLETRVAVASLSGKIVENVYFRTPPDPMKALREIAERVKKLCARTGGDRIEGIGVSARGLVDSQRGIVYRGNDPAWSKIPVQEHLETKLNLPVWVENNVRAAALAEYHYGSPDVQDAHCLMFVMMAEGIGVSLIFDGELFYGQHQAAGEFGQMVIAEGEGPARHDRPGCLERLVASGAICERYKTKDGARAFPGTRDTNSCVRQICHLAMAGDKAAQQTLRESARYIGIGISNIVWGLDPDAVVIDGPCTEAWPLIAPVLRSQFADGEEFLNFWNLVLRPSALRGEAVIVGTAALPFQTLFASGERARKSRGIRGLAATSPPYSTPFPEATVSR